MAGGKGPPARNGFACPPNTARRSTRSSREGLLGQLVRVGSTHDIVAAFQVVGTSEPVRLTQPQKVTLLHVIEVWAGETDGGLPALPEGIFALRNALDDDLHDRGDQ